MGTYQKGPQLGSGFSGVVYQARDTTTGKIYAIKVLHSHIPTPWAELTLAQEITHRNVCRVHHAYIEEDQTHIVMEFVDGETLKTRMARAGAMPGDASLQILRQVLDGLEEIHRAKIVHRDLSPNNIMIARDGTVKIMDFGLARKIEAPVPDRTHSKAVGTPGFISPEQALGENADERSDLFAVGSLLYQMVCGKKNGREHLKAVPGVPTYIEAAILRCVTMDPSRRFSSVRHLRTALFGSRLYRPVPSYTGLLVASLFIVIGVWAAVYGMTSAQIRRAAAAVPIPASSIKEQDLPTLAIVFDGEAGHVFANAIVRGRKFRVVDRTRIETLLAEVRRTRVGIDKGIAEHIGRVVGAEYYVFGTSEILDGSRIRIDAQLVETETTFIKISEGVRGKPENAEQLAELLAGRFHL